MSKESGVLWMPSLWFPVSIGFCPGQAEWDALMKKVGKPWDYPTYPLLNKELTGAEFHSFFNKHPEAAGYLPMGIMVLSDRVRKRSRNMIASVIAHESVHGAQFLFKSIGEMDPSEEFQAYTVQAICYFMLNAFDDTHRAAKKQKEKA